jgi:glycosyltransferase involved in cell wall biosynthesis
MIAPTFVGTGQQVKIFEALAMGTPVIAYRSAVPEDIISECPSIITVETPADFALTISRLIADEDIRMHYWSLASKAAEQQATLRSSLPYTRSLREVLTLKQSKRRICA